MSVLSLRNVPEDLRNKYKAVLAARGQNMTHDILEHMKKTIEKGSKKGDTA